MIEAMSQTVADVIGRIGIISIWKTHPRRSPINEKSPILTTSENQALLARILTFCIYVCRANKANK